ELDRFVNRRMLRRPEEKKLIDSQTQQITRIMIEMLGAQAADPEIEQGQIAQRAVEKFSGEGAVSRGEIAGPEQSREDRVGEVLACPPLAERVERKFTSCLLRHNRRTARSMRRNARATNRMIMKAKLGHGPRIEQIAAIENNRRGHLSFLDLDINCG